MGGVLITLLGSFMAGSRIMSKGVPQVAFWELYWGVLRRDVLGDAQGSVLAGTLGSGPDEDSHGVLRSVLYIV